MFQVLDGSNIKNQWVVGCNLVFVDHQLFQIQKISYNDFDGLCLIKYTHAYTVLVSGLGTDRLLLPFAILSASLYFHVL